MKLKIKLKDKHKMFLFVLGLFAVMPIIMMAFFLLIIYGVI